MRVRLSDEERKAKKKAQSAAWRRANPEKVRAMKAADRLAHLERYRAKRRERYSKNKEHEKKMALAYQAANPEKAKAYTDKWRKCNPESVKLKDVNRRARKKNNGGKLSIGVTPKLLTHQRGKCAVCKINLKKTGFHLDHIIPLSLGGKNTDSNIQLTCPNCNQKKGSKHPIQFMQTLGYLL